jgi:hypothetical protein
VVHQAAYQLIVTHRGAGPGPGAFAKWWEFSNPRLNGQKRSQIRAIAVDRGFAEIWLGQSLVNGAKPSRISSF